MFTGHNLARLPADFIQFLQGNDIFVGGNLKNTVGRGVKNEFPGADVLFPQLPSEEMIETEERRKGTESDGQ